MVKINILHRPETGCTVNNSRQRNIQIISQRKGTSNTMSTLGAHVDSEGPLMLAYLLSLIRVLDNVEYNNV